MLRFSKKISQNLSKAIKIRFTSLLYSKLQDLNSTRSLTKIEIRDTV